MINTAGFVIRKESLCFVNPVQGHTIRNASACLTVLNHQSAMEALNPVYAQNVLSS